MTNSAPSTQQETAGDARGRPDDWSAGLVIAVDGPAGSGKSSAARGAARELHLRYLDTGAMYRALTWWLLSQGTDPADPVAVLREFRGAAIEIGMDPAAPRISVAGQDVAGPVRTRQVSNAVSAVAGLPPVREHLIRQQQEIIAAAVTGGDGIVAEGRDIGSVVAPEAEVKVFLTASEAIRAQRRSADLAADPAATAELTRQEQARRDRRDAPQMARAADAVEIDTTALGLDQVIAEIVGLARSRRAVRRG
ncbi:MAG TPA: (d)CMP kinase [Streptosporangiaceae bacterium]|nr:(d)CMP kinase [Streptosporangiaceae bacterium]